MTDNVADFEEMAERVRKGESTTAEPPWMKLLTLTERNIPHGNVHNVIQGFRLDPVFAGKCWFNELKQQPMRGRMPWDTDDRD